MKSNMKNSCNQNQLTTKKHFHIISKTINVSMQSNPEEVIEESQMKR